MAHDVFISYSSRDKTTADAVVHALEAQGIRCWVAPRDVPAGRSWKESIVQAIRDSQAMVLIFSGDANSSQQVHREVDIAFEAGYPIVPFRIEDVEMSEDLYYCIGSRHWLDGLSPHKEKHIEQLVQAVRRLLAPPAEEVPQPAPAPVAASHVPSPAAPRPATTRPAPAAPPTRVEARTGRAAVRRRILPLALGGVVFALLALWLATQLDVWGPPHVVVDVSSEAVTLVPSEEFELVGLAQTGARPGTAETAGIRLDPPLAYVRGVTVQLPRGETGDSAIEVQGDRALPALALQRLHATPVCTLHLDRLVDGSVRLGIFARMEEGGAQEECRVHGQLWTGPPLSPALMEDLLEEEWLPLPPRQVVGFEALPTPARPVSLNFRPAEPLQLYGLGVRGIAFETRERGPFVESAVLGGTVRFPRAGGEVAQVRMRDTLLLDRLDGAIRALTVGDSIHTVYEGTSSNPRIAQRSLAPGLLAQLYHAPPFWVGLGLLTLAAVALAAFRVT